MEEASQSIDRAVSGLEQCVDNLNLGLTSLALGRLPPQLFPPDKLLNVLANITKVLPKT